LQKNKSYPSKWLITYQGKPYVSVYGKKKAYDLFVRLSHCVNGLQVEAAPRRKSERTYKDKREYHREWRANNKDKVREYNRRSYRKRKQKMLLEQIREEGLNIMENVELTNAEAYMDYLKWLRHEGLPEWMREELANMKEAEIAECFGQHLTFGTGGLRALIGIGTNRMNIYTVRKATQGLADYLKKTSLKSIQPSVVIAYDSRQYSREFAEEAALVLACNGIKAYVFSELCPTPILSFAVRHLRASAGIVITASHNPPSYNGYKVYGPDGAQISSDTAASVMDMIDQVEDELNVRIMDKRDAIAKKRYETIGREIFEAYYEHLMTIIQDQECIREQADELKIVYTPLHGTGAVPVREALTRAGFRQLYLVLEQERPDGFFSTVRSPNPEDPEALEMAIRLAQKVGADIVIGTDPDTDRAGLAVRGADGSYVCLTGNEIGALMLNYLLSQLKQRGQLPENGVMIKTIVTSELGRAIASSYGVQTLETLTGFKYIGAKIHQMKQDGTHRFLFGYEESYGYLIGDFARDKDGVQACLFISEMAAYYKSRGKSLLDVLNELHERFGYYIEDQHSIVLEGIEGVVQIHEIMHYMRNHFLPELAGWRVNWVRDYERGTEYHLASNMLRTVGLPKSNVIMYLFSNSSWFAVRPSGTEPKLKIYFSTIGSSKEEALLNMKRLKEAVLEMIGHIRTHLNLEVVVK